MILQALGVLFGLFGFRDGWKGKIGAIGGLCLLGFIIPVIWIDTGEMLVVRHRFVVREKMTKVADGLNAFTPRERAISRKTGGYQ